MDITDYHINSLVRFTSPKRKLANLLEYPEADDPLFAARDNRLFARQWF